MKESISAPRFGQLDNHLSIPSVGLRQATPWFRLAFTGVAAYHPDPLGGHQAACGPTCLEGSEVMLDFEVQKFTRQCAATQRDLQPGERFFSVLVPQGGQVVRLDYAADAWQGAPPDSIGWWQSEVPDPRANRLQWAPNDVMLHSFEQFRELPDQQDLTYVLTLLMIRRRIFRLEATETDGSGHEVLVVYCARNESEYRIPVATPTQERAEAIQRELALLFFARGETAS